ncbi:MAG TPA: hypothetical protein VK862_03510 [Afifellaceae bacterium]|nr:hypothetical protein [Afifellaceae bacterium]
MPRFLLLRSVITLCVLVIGWSTAIAQPRGMSPADCAAEADRAARSAGSALGGATRGAARGAVFGAIVGGKDSARRGAAVGAVAGGARRASIKNSTYVQVYDACMRGTLYRN